MLKASFKTAYLQREVPMTVAVAGDKPLVVGEMVTLTAASGAVPASIKSAATVAAATHIIAQSDMTMEYGHVPVENRDYKYSDEVAATIAAAGPVTASTPTKKVALFAITDKDDLIVKTVAQEVNINGNDY